MVCTRAKLRFGFHELVDLPVAPDVLLLRRVRVHAKFGLNLAQPL
jgi:hypothetical protein